MRRLLRHGLALTAMLLNLGLSLSAHAQSVAFTFDDGPRLASGPLLSPDQRNAAILAALKKQGVQAALFVTAGNGADQPLAWHWPVPGARRAMPSATIPSRIWI